LDLKDRKIRVNVVSPGPIETPGIAGLAPKKENGGGFIAGSLRKCRWVGWGSRTRLPKVAVLLASEDSSFVTGIELFADGGIAQV
jgi:NAD(P)-dependent dehydrogenase (short-subunit alcohol dehydrogenase family)